MSSSDDSDDELIKRIQESTDKTLFTNSLYKKEPELLDLASEKKKDDPIMQKTIPKSQRYIEFEEIIDTDIKVSQSMQDHIGKKLSAIIEKLVEFVEPRESCKEQKHKKIKNRLKLLKDFNEPIKYLFEETFTDIKIPRKKPVIKRRVIEDDNVSKSARINASVIESSVILSGSDIKHWAKRRLRNDKIFRYKQGKSGVLHFIEPENEFTTLRHKNCWSVKKIANWKKK